MAVGPYAQTNQINEHRLDNLLKGYNDIIGATTGPAAEWSTIMQGAIHSTLFNGATIVPYQADSSTGGNVAMTPGLSLLFESGTTGTSTIDFTTAGHSAVIVLQNSGSMNFVDEGSAGDAGDIIIASSAAQYIAIGSGNTGSNTIVGGAGQDTLVGGSTADRLLGGGLSSMVAGTGTETLIGGFFATSHDTLVGSSGTDILKVKFGSNVIIAGSGTETIKSGFNGASSDQISLTAGGTAQVTIGAASTDTVTYGGGGHDTLSVSGSADVEIQHGEVFTGISVAAGVTTLNFADGSLSYEGTGTVHIHFN